MKGGGHKERWKRKKGKDRDIYQWLWQRLLAVTLIHFQNIWAMVKWTGVKL